MKKRLLLIVLLFAIKITNGQNVGIGTDSPSPYARLEVSDSTRGILIPRLDSTQRKSIVNTVGLLVYDKTTKSFWFNDGIKWNEITVSSFVDNRYKKSLTHIYLVQGF